MNILNLVKIISFVFAFSLALSILPNKGAAQTATFSAEIDKVQAQKDKAEVSKWGEATLIMRDENGKLVMKKTEKYPIPNSSTKTVTAANVPFDNCWNFCRNVCNGYGVCWTACGWHCSPWTR